jgi:4-hydroxy-tetrahydrodipicolinate reductase
MRGINLAVAGATGWTGSAIVDAALTAPDITLTSAVARSSAGQDLGAALGRQPLGVPVHENVAEALDGVDVLVEFTSHAHAKEIALTAIERGVAVVIGSSGLTADDYAHIDAAARAAGVGAIAAGNFSFTAAMMLAAAELAARHLPSMGDHRLRHVDQARRAERHRARARRAPPGSPQASATMPAAAPRPTSPVSYWRSGALASTSASSGASTAGSSP